MTNAKCDKIISGLLIELFSKLEKLPGDALASKKGHHLQQ